MKNYHAVGNRCACNIEEFPGSTLEILASKGFKVLDVDIIELARERIGNAVYRRGARLHEAPNAFDCSSFMKWIYGQKGIWLPRRSIQQSEVGVKIPLTDIRAGDLIFTKGWINYFRNDPKDGIGHVGMATGEGTVIHAADNLIHLKEVSLEAFVEDDKDAIIRRYFDEHTITFETPHKREVECSDDILWITLSSKRFFEIEMENREQIESEVAGWNAET
ncbi:C40 family peptidase [Candidatus Parcubacteria bacterium]|nr:C40 family peptidase [Candidatus Parcubacteria bacterium]